MGAPNFGLIPAAILLDNPGLTKEELVNKLSEVPCFGMMEPRESAPWDYYDPVLYSTSYSDFHKGLHGLGRFLSLPETERYAKVMKGRDTRIDLAKRVVLDGEGRYKTAYRVWFEGMKPNETYDSLESLVSSHPYFDPEFQYDFSQEYGKLKVEAGLLDIEHNLYFWKQKDGKYSLDTDRLLDNIPESTEVGYTSLILAAEAVKHKAWKLLGRNGDKFEQQFLHDFDDSRMRYETAVRDIWMSFAARKKGMTIMDLLRMRLLTPFPNLGKNHEFSSNPYPNSFSRMDYMDSSMQRRLYDPVQGERHIAPVQASEDDVPF